MSTVFEDVNRFGPTTTGSGTVSLGNDGATLNTGATSSSYADITMRVVGSIGQLQLGSPDFSALIANTNTAGTTGIRVIMISAGMTVSGAGYTLTESHAGFKLITASSVTSLYATQANGTTETASAALTTIAYGQARELAFRINGTSSIDYYWRTIGGTWSSPTNLSTNLPGNCGYFQIGCSNTAVATEIEIECSILSYSR
jgi:hypothetical protein